ncbi:MAG TPA: M24 family metallopeptidase [Gemmataceae bacterium]|nr:M24 family metallopeptidase [Gemmataceae bacterium]
MNPDASGPLRIDEDDDMTDPSSPGTPSVNGSTSEIHLHGLARRTDIDGKQERLLPLLEELGCEAVLLLMPAHVGWFTNGLNARGLIADSERPGVYTNGRQRWLLCSNIDTHRLFDEELDQLGFQLKEWSWDHGRADLLMNVVTGRKVACDRPFPGMPMLNEKLRPLLRVLSEFERETYADLGRLVAHAVEATARSVEAGQTEEAVAGHLGHRLLHHSAEPVGVSVTADGRGAKFRRAGFSNAAIQKTCVIQATAQKHGLFATTSRTVSLGPPPPELRSAHDFAVRQAAVSFSLSVPGQNIEAGGNAGQLMLAGTPHEYDWRLSQPGYGAGRFPAEELRRGGSDEPFVEHQAVVWQARVGQASVVETMLVSPRGAVPVTPPEDWPFKRVKVGTLTCDVPDILVIE